MSARFSLLLDFKKVAYECKLTTRCNEVPTSKKYKIWKIDDVFVDELIILSSLFKEVVGWVGELPFSVKYFVAYPSSCAVYYGEE